MRQILLGFDASLHFVKLPSGIECGNRGALKDYGTLITSPFQVRQFETESNVPEIEVASVSANRIHDLGRWGPAGAGWKILTTSISSTPNTGRSTP